MTAGKEEKEKPRLLVWERLLMRVQAFCADSWGLNEGQQLDGDEKRQSIY